MGGDHGACGVVDRQQGCRWPEHKQTLRLEQQLCAVCRDAKKAYPLDGFMCEVYAE